MNNKNLHSIEFKLKKLLDWGLFGGFKSKVSGAWMEFMEHKQYNLWDEAKDIDWKASSKTWELYVKKYEAEKDLNVLFVMDTSETMQFWTEDKIKQETLIETFYSLAISAYYNNDNVWAIVYNNDNLEFLDYKKSKENIYKILEYLTSPLTHLLKGDGKEKNFPPTKGDLNKGFDEIKTRKIKNNLIFILTDKTDFDLKKLRYLNNDNEIVIINIFDKFENELFEVKTNISLNLWNDFLNIDLADNKKIEEFKNLRQKKLDKLKYDLEKNNIWYILLDNKSDIMKELVNYFKKI